MSEKSPEALKCPRCIDETLVKTIGNLLVCPNCEIQLLIYSSEQSEKSETVDSPPA